ncbi:hypothetical protein [Salinibacter grassmerensis]|uniref:hypothetical protein n=1 Tax=Salinibacter grassmerensis TaxID=3040353 RepID=UPI0021E889D3|nr:hypothetical protein [Salinibacter grassmerensis]
MRKVALRIVYFLTVYLPLEDFLLKWIPVPYPIYLGLRQASDALVLILAGMVLGMRFRATRRFRIVGRGADFCLVAFVGLALCTVALREGNLLYTVLNLKALLRYVLLVYALLNLSLRRAEVYVLLRLMYVSLGIQFIVSMIQIAGPVSIDQFFFPRVQGTEVAGVELGSTAYRESEKGYISGTMTNNISYGGFLLVGLATYVTRYIRDRRTLLYWGAVAVFLFLAYMSGSRAVTFAVVLLVATDHYLSGEAGQFLKVSTLTFLPFVPLVLLMGVNLSGLHIFEVFSAEYLRVAMEQRLGIVLNVLPQFLTDLSVADVLFGLSPDRTILRRFVADVTELPAVLIGNVAVIEDVYWVALPVYYGLAGLGLFVGFFALVAREVYRIAQKGKELLERRLARIALLLLVVAVPLNLIGQYFETRQFSFYLWLFVGVSLSYTYTRIVTDQRASS